MLSVCTLLDGGKAFLELSVFREEVQTFECLQQQKTTSPLSLVLINSLTLAQGKVKAVRLVFFQIPKQHNKCYVQNGNEI